jgi:hypothetical protein
MAAGMHLAGHRRSVGLAESLGDGQRVHVGAQADGGTLAPAAADQADDAGLAHAGDHLVAAEFAQLFGHEGGGLVLLVAQFGMAVDVMAPLGDFILQFGGAVQNGHWGFPVWEGPAAYASVIGRALP